VTSPTAARPDRYGTRPRRLRARGWAIVGAAALCLGVGWAAWVAWSGAEDKVAWTDVSFTVVDDGTTLVTFEVNRHPGRVVVCTVRALNAGFAEVGLVDVTVAASGSRTAQARATIPTSELAVSGTVKDCAARP
jgi:hypothetical protein